MAPAVNLKLSKFQALAAVLPDYARFLDDAQYCATDIYIKDINFPRILDKVTFTTIISLYVQIMQQSCLHSKKTSLSCMRCL